MTDAHIIAGDLTANLADRVVSGLLLPYGEVGSTNLGKFSIDGPGLIEIPADVSVLMANADHSQLEPRARFLTATDTGAGIVASFKVGENPEGDELLAEIDKGRKTGRPKALSAEVKSVVIKAGKAIAGKLTGAAFVERGAFPSAALLASAVDTAEPEHVQTAPAATAPVVVEKPVTVTEPKKEDAVGAATIPETLKATAPAGKKPLSKTQVFDILHAIHEGRADQAMLAALTEVSGVPENALFAALNDVKYDGTGGLTTGIDQGQWLGQIWDGNSYVRKYLPLFNHGDLTSLKLTGYKWNVKPAGGTWAGNKAAIPSNAPSMQPVTGSASRYAGGHDLAREFQDLQAFGDRSFFDAYWAAMSDDYAKWSDQTITLTQILAGATTVVADNPASLSIGAGLSAIIDGATEVIAADAIPSFAIVETSLWKQIAKTPHSDVLGYLNASLHLTGESGQLDTFSILPSSALTTGNVLVGAKQAATVFELPGVPVRVSAPDMVKGGIDTGLFGYSGVVINKATALQLVTPYVTP